MTDKPPTYSTEQLESIVDNGGRYITFAETGDLARQCLRAERERDEAVRDSNRIDEFEALQLCIGHAPSGNWTVFAKDRQPYEISRAPTMREAMDAALLARHEKATATKEARK